MAANFANLRGHCNHGPSVQNIGLQRGSSRATDQAWQRLACALGWPDCSGLKPSRRRVAGQPDEAIRALVNKLHAQRTERFEALTQTVAHA